ncbi:MAG: RNA polymerase sigma factor SigW, partial [Candidatus Moranbacteria bacterium CG_4_9_14_3_um_filter_42_9]
RLVGNKEEAEDILQNVFVKAYRNIKTFDIERKFSSWIYRIAHNEAINFLKKKNKRIFVSWEDIVTSKDKLETKSEERSPIDIWIREESRLQIQEALGHLPEKYQKVLLLRYFSEKSYEEIGHLIGSPVNTVGTIINRAKKKLMVVINLMEGH